MPDTTAVADRKEERLDADTLRATRRSTFTGRVNTLDLPIRADEWELYRNQPSMLIQDVFPSLSLGEREFLLTGTTQAEWDAAFPPEEEEEAT